MGTFTTTSVGDLLTNSVVVTPSLKVISSIQFTNVPLMEMFVPGFASAVIEVIITGTSKSNTVFDSMSPCGVLRITLPASASIGTTNSITCDETDANWLFGTSIPGKAMAVT